MIRSTRGSARAARTLVALVAIVATGWLGSDEAASAASLDRRVPEPAAAPVRVVNGNVIEFPEVAEVMATDTVTIFAPAGWTFTAHPTVGPIAPVDIVAGGATGIVTPDGSRIVISFLGTNLPGYGIVVVSLPMTRVSGAGPLGSMSFAIGGVGRASGTTGTLTGVVARSAAPAPAATPSAGAGTFVAAPVFGSGTLAQVVFAGGTVAQLEAALIANGASGAWAQDASGRFLSYIVGVGFVNNDFYAAFPKGFASATALTVVKK